jgi:rod shape-determining protein MreB
MRSGITLTGGGALLDGLDNYIEAEIGVAVNIADEPLNCVAIGTGVALDNLRALKGALISYKD